MSGSESMPLRTRLAAIHGDADQAAKLLDEAARDFHRDIKRLLATPAPKEHPAPARRGLRLGFGGPASQRSPEVVAAQI